MTLQLAPLTSALLSLAWQTEPGMTYTLRISSDLQTWDTLDYVVQGNGLEESYFFDNLGKPLFVALQYDNDGDTDDNALPDMWEWQYLGQIGANANDDPDEDGFSNFDEWLNNTDPMDFYDGSWPVIQLACGREWLVPAGNVSSQQIALSVCKPSGEPWSHAPVYLQTASGNSDLVLIGRQNSYQNSSFLRIWTDALGRIDSSLESIHVRSPGTAGTVEEISIQAGQADAAILIHAIGGTFGSPPRNLSKYVNMEGQSIYSWSGDPGDADSFSLEEADPDGNWTPVIEIKTSQLTPPDPVYGTYQLTIGN